jgi:NADH-quinone oxidoreductase subunit C
MTTPEILEYLKQKFPAAEFALDGTVPEPSIVVPRAHLQDVARLLRDDDSLHFECLMCLSGIEYDQELHTVYNLYSMMHGHKCSLRCKATRDDPVMPTVSCIWSTAEWHERESFDLLGIVYEGHPDPRRILCPYDWEGHPLRKDYVPPKKWHDIPLEAILPEDLARRGEA